MSPALLEVDGMTCRFGRLIAVDNLSFQVGAGDIFGIAGPNGAGKSTAFNAITRIPFGPQEGTVRFKGQRIDGIAPHRIARRGLTRTFQTETVFGSLTALENVAVATAGSSERTEDVRIQETLEFVEMWDERNRPGRDLSLVGKKKLMIASALAMEPSLLLLDEPASGLNKVEQQQIVELVRRINGRGISVVVIEHVLPLLLELAERMMVMVDGQKLIEGPPRDILTDDRVVEAYIGTRGLT